MTDTLKVFGTEYTGVTGLKATDINDNVLTYIRPQGSLSITSNDTYDVTAYASAVVSVSGGSVTITDESNATGTTCVITTGSSPTPSIPLNEELIKFADVVNGYVISESTGEEEVSQWSCCSDFTLVDESMTFSYVGYKWYNIAFYDENKTYLGYLYMNDDATTITNDYASGSLTPAKFPSGTMYVRINSYPTNPTSSEMSLIRTA